MKKYLQITIVLGLFFLLVLFRSLRGSDEGNRVIGTPSQQNLPNGSVTPSPSGASAPPQNSSAQNYKDGTYTGSVEDAYYGNIQVQAVISNGKISDVIFLQYPNDNRTSQFINSQAMPILKQEAITAQSAQVDIVSGASQTSPAFSRSLSNALSQAK